MFSPKLIVSSHDTLTWGISPCSQQVQLLIVTYFDCYQPLFSIGITHQFTQQREWPIIIGRHHEPPSTISQSPRQFRLRLASSLVVTPTTMTIYQAVAATLFPPCHALPCNPGQNFSPSEGSPSPFPPLSLPYLLLILFPSLSLLHSLPFLLLLLPSSPFSFSFPIPSPPLGAPSPSPFPSAFPWPSLPLLPWLLPWPPLPWDLSAAWDVEALRSHHQRAS